MVFKIAFCKKMKCRHVVIIPTVAGPELLCGNMCETYDDCRCKGERNVAKCGPCMTDNWKPEYCEYNLERLMQT